MKFNLKKNHVILFIYFILKEANVIPKMKKYLYSCDGFIEIEVQLLYSRDASFVIDYCKFKFVWGII